MKQFYRTLALAWIALLPIVAFTSCDEDTEEAMVLSGEWTGDFNMYYTDRYGYEYDAAYTDLRMIPAYDYATYGTGQQVDFYSRPCPVRYQSFYFTWEVRNGRIYLTYPYDHNLDVVIRDYRLNESRFTGYFGDTNSSFYLRKLSGFYWGDYGYGSNYYGYGYYDEYSDYFYYGSGYAKSRTPAGGALAVPDSIDLDVAGFKQGRRM